MFLHPHDDDDDVYDVKDDADDVNDVYDVKDDDDNEDPNTRCFCILRNRSRKLLSVRQLWMCG